MTSKTFVDKVTTIDVDWTNDVDAAVYEAIGDGSLNPPTTPAQVRSNIDVNSATDLASTAAGKGASLIGIQDAAADWTATNQEALNAEIADKLDGTLPITPDIDGGTVDGAIVGGTTPAAGSFTVLSGSTRTDTTIFRQVPPSTSGTDTYTVTTGFGALTTNEVITVNFATANTSTTPTLNRDSLGAKTIKTPSGAALVAGDLTGIHRLRYDGTDYLALDVLEKGHILQVVNSTDGAVATGTTLIPYDDTVPQNTEGDQYLSLAVTPKATTSKLKIECVIILSNSAANNMTVALFQDTTASAIASTIDYVTTATGMRTVSFTYYMTAGTTSATTFKVRAGGSAAGTTTVNGASAARKDGGVLASSITITEIKA